MQAKLNLTFRPDGAIHTASVNFRDNAGRSVTLTFDPAKAVMTPGQEGFVYSDIPVYGDKPVCNTDPSRNESAVLYALAAIGYLVDCVQYPGSGEVFPAK